MIKTTNITKCYVRYMFPRQHMMRNNLIVQDCAEGDCSRYECNLYDIPPRESAVVTLEYVASGDILDKVSVCKCILPILLLITNGIYLLENNLPLIEKARYHYSLSNLFSLDAIGKLFCHTYDLLKCFTLYPSKDFDLQFSVSNIIF
jgi:hypothetical protein